MPHEFDDWRERSYQCQRCNWSGRGSELQRGEIFSEVYEMDCPRCGQEAVAVIQIPTWEEKRQNWDKLSEEDKRAVEAFEAHLQEFERRKLRSPDQLPDLQGESLVVVWDTNEKRGETSLELDLQVLWTEPAVWEGYWRFIQVAQILSLKFGARLKDLVPTDRSEVWLYGDILRDEPYEQVKYCRHQLREKHDEPARQAELYAIVDNCQKHPGGAIIGLLETLRFEHSRKSLETCVRKEAAKRLGAMGAAARDAVPALIEALRDPDDVVRCAAVEALGEIGPDAQSAEAALTNLLSDPEGLLRIGATKALRKIGAS